MLHQLHYCNQYQTENQHYLHHLPNAAHVLEYKDKIGSIEPRTESYYKHKKRETDYSKRVQQELNNTELKVNLYTLALELGKQKVINKPLLNKSDCNINCIISIYATNNSIFITAQHRLPAPVLPMSMRQ